VREAFTERSGVRIRYLDNAPTEPVGLPILFSPGFTDFADEYVEVLEFFSPRRVLVVEVRGRGGSDTPTSGYTAADHASDLRAVLDEEGVERFHAMTFSRGTTWCLDVVLSDPARVASVSIGDYWAREHALGVDVADQLMTTRFRGVAMAERVEPHVLPALFGASRDRDLLGELGASGLPVLVATGTEPGCILDAATVEEFRVGLADVEIVTIEGASHDLFRADRLAYPSAVADFVDRHQR
jgi:pimeloyl-ACP methyl ester carboxylesterase